MILTIQLVRQLSYMPVDFVDGLLNITVNL